MPSRRKQARNFARRCFKDFRKSVHRVIPAKKSLCLCPVSKAHLHEPDIRVCMWTPSYRRITKAARYSGWSPIGHNQSETSIRMSRSLPDRSPLGLRGWRQTSPSLFLPPLPLQTYCSLHVFSGFTLANAQATSLTERMLSLFICSIHSAVQICEIYKYTISSDKYLYVKVKVIVLISVVTTILELSSTDNNRGP